MKSLLCLLACALATLPLGSEPGRGAVVALDLEALTHAAPLIVRGRVRGHEMRWSVDVRGEVIVTDHRVEVTEVLKGAATVGAELVLQTEGGAVGSVRMLASEEPTVQIGETVLLFLAPHPEAPGCFKSYGGFQGKYTILRERLREARDRDWTGFRAEILAHAARQRGDGESGR